MSELLNSKKQQRSHIMKKFANKEHCKVSGTTYPSIQMDNM